jgi:hypothetical protein
MERVLGSHGLWAVTIDCNSNRSTNKSNHPIQNPLLFVTEPRTRDNIIDNYTFRRGLIIFFDEHFSNLNENGGYERQTLQVAMQQSLHVTALRRGHSWPVHKALEEATTHEVYNCNQWYLLFTAPLEAVQWPLVQWLGWSISNACNSVGSPSPEEGSIYGSEKIALCFFKYQRRDNIQ